MKRLATFRMIAILGGAIALASHAWAAESPAQKKAEGEVREAVNGIVAAYGANNVPKYFSYMADDMGMTSGARGWNTKEAYNQMWTTQNAKEGVYASCKVSELRVQVSPLGDSAISTFAMPCVRNHPPAGQEPPITFNMTEVWHKIDNKWLVESMSYAAANAESASPLAPLTKWPTPPASPPAQR